MNYQQAFEKLKNGCKSYLESKSNPSTFSQEIRTQLSVNGQKPYAVIISCSDSRVPVEHIFSAGMGELFVIRNAGNIVGNLEIASTEYAVKYLGTTLVLVLGHTNCGAVGAALNSSENKEGYENYILEEVRKSIGNETEIRKCEILNAMDGVKRLKQSPILSKLEEEDKLKIISGIYDIDSGNVFFDKVEVMSY